HIHIEGENDFGKPDARVFRGALRALDCVPAEAWMIGDDLKADIEGAMDAGLTAIWVDNAGLGVPAASAVTPHRIIRAITELVAQDCLLLAGPTQRTTVTDVSALTAKLPAQEEGAGGQRSAVDRGAEVFERLAYAPPAKLVD